MRIGIFDSGLGGINVLKELLNKYPKNEYIFLGDTKNLPYGSKSVSELEQLASSNIDFLLTKNVDLIIIACGTVSSNCYDYLKAKYNVPIYDIISPTLDYINNSNFNNIGVIATTSTINSKIFEKSSKVSKTLATPSFVPIIEDGIITENEEKEVSTVLEPLKDNIDSLVLGCTHYPLLSNLLSSYLNVPLIDMGKCLINKLNLSNDGEFKIDLYFTNINNQLLNNLKTSLNFDYNVEKIDLS